VDILFLTDNFPPETNAPASRTYEHAKRWVREGHRVTVITSFPNFPDGKIFHGYKNRLRQKEMIDGIEIIRIWTYITANEGFIKRSLDQLSFGIGLVFAGLIAPRPHVVVGTSPQFFTVVGGYVLSRLISRPFVFELRDLWPDSITAVGAMRESFIIRSLRQVEYYLYHRANRIVSVTHSFKNVLIGKGVPADKIEVIPNGVDLETYQPGDKPINLVGKWKVDGKFVAAYVGTIGMAHGLGTVLEAAKKLKARTDIAFLLVGTGAEQAALAQRCKDTGLENVIFVGSVSKAEVREYWKLCDVALVLLRDSPLFAHVIPSKMFEAMGMERPIILGVRGESRSILEAAQAGIPITPEDSGELVDAVVKLADNPALCMQLGKAGREFASREFNRDHLASQMLAVLESSVNKKQ